MGGGATDAMLQARYGYGRGRGPRRMPVRMSTTLPHGVPPGSGSLRSGEGASFGGVGDEVADDMFGVNIPDELFATEMATLGRGVGAIGNSLRNLQRAGVSSVIPSISASSPVDHFGDIGDRAVAELFGADEDDEDDEDDEGSGEEKKGFSLKSLPSWVLPVAAGTAAAAGAVGLGLALTSKKRKAKKAAKEEQFGAMSEIVAAQMFGDDEDDEDDEDEDEDEDSPEHEALESAEHERREHRRSKKQARKDRRSSQFGDDPTRAVFQFGPGPSSAVDALPPQPMISPPSPAAPSSPQAGQGSPSWHQVKRATHDAFRAQKRLDRAQQDYAAAQAKVPAFGAYVPQFGAYVAAYGSHIAQYGSYIPNFGALPHLPDASSLQRFVSNLPSTASGLYDKASELILAYTGPMTALRNKGRLTSQYEAYKAAVKAEGGFGPNSQSAANQGVDLVQQISGLPVSSYDRQAMVAVARAQVPLILQGLG